MKPTYKGIKVHIEMTRAIESQQERNALIYHTISIHDRNKSGKATAPLMFRRCWVLTPE